MGKLRMDESGMVDGRRRRLDHKVVGPTSSHHGRRWMRRHGVCRVWRIFGTMGESTTRMRRISI